jgi:DNA-binding TFAR19-related protein (PDSD5 family)
MGTPDDVELRRLMNKKLKELAARSQPRPHPQSQSQSQKPSPKDILSTKLFDRADEVLAAAEAQYPAETKAIVERLAQLYSSGRLTSPMSGGELLYLFRRLGLNVRIETSIKVEEHGKFVDLSEKLRSEKE